MLRDVMSGAHMGFFAQAALILFLLAFTMIVIRLWRQPQAEVNEQANLPLADEPQPGQHRSVSGGDKP